MNYLAVNLNYLRKKKKLRQESLSAQIGSTRATLSNYENGVSEPSIEMLIKMSHFFGVTLDEMICKDIQTRDVQLGIAEADEKINRKIYLKKLLEPVLKDNAPVEPFPFMQEILQRLNELSTAVTQMKEKNGLL